MTKDVGLTPKDVFGSNPYNENWVKDNLDIRNLSELYQSHLASLCKTHQRILDDNDHFNKLMKNNVNAQNKLVKPLSEKMILMKQGLDHRLDEFAEDCKRLQKIERQLQAKIDNSTIEYETAFFDAQGMAEKRLLQKISQQQKLINLQKRDIEDLKVREQVYKQETCRIKKYLQNLSFNNSNDLSKISTNRKRINEIDSDIQARYIKQHLGDKSTSVNTFGDVKINKNIKFNKHSTDKMNHDLYQKRHPNVDYRTFMNENGPI